MANKNSNRILYFLSWVLGGVILFSALCSSWWFFLKNQFNSEVEDWIALQRESKIAVNYEKKSFSGFPFSLKITFYQPILNATQKVNPLIWRGKKAVLAVKVWDLKNIFLDLSGPQKIKLIVKGRASEWEGDSKKLLLNLNLKNKKVSRLQINLKNINIAPKSIKSIFKGQSLRLDSGKILIVKNKNFNLKDESQNYFFLVDLFNFYNFETLPNFFGNKFSNIIFKADVLGPLPEAINLRQIASWRDSGGIIEVSNFEIDHGPLKIKAKGTLALDDALQPVGAFSSQIAGLFNLIKKLEEKNIINPDLGLTARLVLGIFTKRKSPENQKLLEIGLTIQKQKIFLGPLSIAKFPFIYWEKFNKVP